MKKQEKMSWTEYSPSKITPYGRKVLANNNDEVFCPEAGY